MNLKLFIVGYMAAIESTLDDDGPACRDWSPEALATARKHCAAFIERAGELLNEYTYSSECFPSAVCAGHDFWFTRNRHGAGFGDRGLGDVGDELTKIAQSFHQCGAFVYDNGQLALN